MVELYTDLNISILIESLLAKFVWKFPPIGLCEALCEVVLYIQHVQSCIHKRGVNNMRLVVHIMLYASLQAMRVQIKRK